MSRQSSIPVDLEPALVRRWVEGASPRSLLRWIEESNPTRKTPITTTVSSVLRCIERAAARNSSVACVASVHRARLRSSALMSTLEEVDDGYRKVYDEAIRSPREFPNNRVNGALKALGKLELSTHRQLKLAGVGTAFGNKLADDHKAFSREMARDIAAEDELEDAGIAPEITVRHLPPELFPPAPLTPEIMAAMRREQAAATATLSESKPPDSQPIVDSNRITAPVPAATEAVTTTTTSGPAAAASTTDASPVMAATATAHLSESEPLVSQRIGESNRITVTPDGRPSHVVWREQHSAGNGPPPDPTAVH